MNGRTIAIGDIHGCDTALSALLDRLTPAGDDTVVVLGDIVDRGPQSRQAVERLIDLSRRCRLVLILGNHEEMMLNALNGGEWAAGWLRYGGDATAASYAGDIRSVPEEHLDFLGSGRDFWQAGGDLFIHANLERGVPLEAQSAEWLRWTHLSGEELPLESGQRILCGHTPQRFGEPLVRPGWVCLDTFACGGGWLTALDTASGEYWQTNQRGDARGGQLAEPS